MKNLELNQMESLFAGHGECDVWEGLGLTVAFVGAIAATAGSSGLAAGLAWGGFLAYAGGSPCADGR